MASVSMHEATRNFVEATALLAVSLRKLVECNGEIIHYAKTVHSRSSEIVSHGNEVGHRFNPGIKQAGSA